MKKLTFILLLVLNSFCYSQNIELGVNTGQTEDIFLGLFTKDEKQFITSGSNTISLWDTKSGKLIRNIICEDGVSSLHFTSDQQAVVVVPLMNQIKCYDINTGKLKYTVANSTNYYQSIESKDGKKVALLSDNSIDILNIDEGKITYSFQPPKGIIIQYCLGSDNNTLYTTSTDSTLAIYNINTGKLIASTKDPLLIRKMNVSNDGKKMVLVDRYFQATIWAADGLKKMGDVQGKTDPWSIKFIDYDQRIIAHCKDSTIRIWNVSTGALEKAIRLNGPYALHISNDQTKALISDISDYVKIIQLPEGKIIDSFECHKGYVRDAIYNKNSTSILTFSQDRSCVIRDAITLKSIISSNPAQINIAKAIFTNDQKNILLVDENNTYTLWDKEKGLLNSARKIDANADFAELVKLYSPKTLFNGQYIISNEGWNIQLIDPVTFEVAMNLKGHKGLINHQEFNSTGDKVVTCSDDSTAIVWDVNTGNKTITINCNTIARDIEFSKDGSKLITGDDLHRGIIWDVKTGKQLFVLKGHTSYIENVGFNYSGTQVATQGSDGEIKVWDVNTGVLQYSIQYERILEASYEFSPDDKYIVTHTNYNTLSVYDAGNGKLLHELSSHKSVITGFDFSFDSKQLITNSWDRSCKIWDMETGKESLTFMNLPNNEWLVLHPSGLFDASPKAMADLYWVQGTEIIEFSQLKDRYYEPGLWTKIIKKDDLREVKGFNEKIPLYPDILLHPIDSKGDLKIELTNNGGGIGKIKVYINGKEIADDIRDHKFNPDAAAANIIQNVKDHPFLIKGDTNTIEVKAYNKDNWVLSLGEKITYIDKRSKQESTPQLFVISIGVSDYTGKEIDLKYPSKDASDMCASIQVGAKRLFGIEKTKGYLLNSTSELKPTKENIKKVFDEISTKANSNDLIIVYLSGHGINWGGDDGDWYYLTQDAFSASSEAYNDEAIRNKSGISSKELSDWVKKIPALKQVMIIDACASGRIVDDLVAQRDVPANTIRSLDRMKDRTGLHIITGCAADAVSYEASRYGQGVLTYSLLEGMKGLSLREGKFVDIITWFQYARERVPALASGIGGIQEPQIISPNGSESFDVGQLEEEDKKLIPLSGVKPMYVRSNFQDEDELDDVLALGDKMDEALNEYSSKGTESTIVFVDVKEFPDAYKLIGRYKRENNQITLTLKVKQGTEIVANLSLTGTDANDVVNQLVKKVNDF